MFRTAFAGILACLSLSLPAQAWAWGRGTGSYSAYPPFSQTFVPLNTFYTPYPLSSTMQWTARPTMGYYATDAAPIHSGIATYSSLPAAYSDAAPVHSSTPTVQYTFTPSYYYQPSSPSTSTVTGARLPNYSPSATWYWR